MKTIKLNSINIAHFKGIEKKEFNFKGKHSSILGANATGKTTVYDAFLWCLFGKDSKGDATFTIKPQDAEGNDIPKLENRVELKIEIDGHSETLTRTQREKWVTKRGSSEATFQGHETIFEMDEVPCKKKDYEERVSSIIEESYFKLITNPAHFNSLKWAERRAILFELVEDVTVEDVAAGDKRFADLLDKVQGKDIDTYNEQLKVKIKKAKDELKLLPSRIDEAHQALPEPTDSKAAQTAIENLREEAQQVRREATRAGEATESQQKTLRKLRQELQTLEDKQYTQSTQAYNEAMEAYEQAVAKQRRQQKQLQQTEEEAADRLRKLEKDRDALSDTIASQDKKIITLRKQWETIQEEQFQGMPEGQKICPTCGREHDPETQEQHLKEAEQAFLDDQQRRADKVAAEGKELAETYEENQKELKQLTKLVKEAQAAHKRAKGNASEKVEDITKPAKEDYTPEKHLLEKIEAKQAAIKEVQNKIQAEEADEAQAREEAETEARRIEAEMEPHQDALAQHKQREKMMTRIDELETRHKQLGQEVAAMEQQQFQIQELTASRINLIEDRINERFEHVQFRMFDKQINEGIKETCVTLVNGVPYPDANQAARINAGIDIINTLSEYYGVSAPLFIDQRESIIKLIDTPAQVINLIVSEAHNTLTLK